MLFDCLNTSWNSFGNFEISNEKVEKQQKEEVIRYKTNKSRKKSN